MDNTIKRGATTENTFYLPDDLSLDDLDRVAVVYRSKRNTLRLDSPDIQIDTEHHALAVELSEAQTLAFSPGQIDIEVILKYKKGSVMRSHIYYARVEDTLLNKEV